MTGHESNRMRSATKVVLLLCILAVPVVSMQAGEGGERVFPLAPVSVFDLPENTRREFLIGQRAVCRDEADPNVTAYPQFRSDQPIYGTAEFGDPLGGREARTVYCLAVDESGGTGKGYDRLYFDLNRDRSLTNDNFLAVQKNPPQAATLNYTDGRRQDMRNRRRVYGIRIREDRPFVFDFSSRPVVMLASPAQDRRVRPGEEINVMAVLTDRVLDIMFRRLQDTSEKRRETTSDGQPFSSSYTDKSLDPRVAIARANGEIVAEGVMPFG